MPKIDLNRASRADLLAVPGIGEAYAERILALRSRTGGFRTTAELAGVRGISEAKAKELAGYLDVPKAPGNGHGNGSIATIRKAIAVRDPGSNSASFAGYRISLRIRLRSPRTRLFRDQALTEEVGEDNQAVFDLAEELLNAAASELQVTLRSPDGQILGRRELSPGQFRTRSITFDARAQTVALAPLAPAASLVKGRVIDLTHGRPLEHVQVVIYVADDPDPADDDYHPLATVESEQGGYFLLTRPATSFGAAYAQVAVSGENRVPIRLEDDGQGAGVFPDRLILVVQPQAEVIDPDCESCDDLGFEGSGEVLEEFSYYTVVRTTDPEIEPLVLEEDEPISLDEVVGDIPWLGVRILSSKELQALHDALAGFLGNGGGNPAFLARSRPPAGDAGSSLLANLKVSRRSLSRFLDAYGTLTPDNLPVLLDLDARDKVRDRLRNGKERSTSRVPLRAENAIDWDDEPTLYQATTLAHGHILAFKQEWLSDGYALGDLLYSLPLAPGQKKQIVVFDWERRESAANMQSIDYQETLNNSLSRDRDINEIATGSVKDNITGGSSANAWGFGVGGGVGAIIPTQVPIGALIGGAGGAGGASSQAWQNSARSSTASSMQNLRDRTVQSANALRSQRSSVIQTVSQGERFEVQSETVANYNHCHALTIQYFEVLRHFQVRQRLVDVQECLFVPLTLSRFDTDKALRWKEILSRYLLDRRLRRGFDALERIRTLYQGSDLPTGTFADEAIEHLEGEFRITLKIARPADTAEGLFDPDAWRFLRAALPHYSAAEFYARHLADVEDRDEAFARLLGPEIAEEVVKNLRLSAVTGANEQDLDLDLALTSEFHNNRPLLVTLRSASPVQGLRRADIRYLKIRSEAAEIDAANLVSIYTELGVSGLVARLRHLLPAHSRIVVESGTVRYRTRHRTDFLFRDQSIRDDLSSNDDVLIYAPLNREELRNPRLEDEQFANWLIAHLNDNLEFYHKAIWMNMTPERRFLLLDRIQGPAKANGRSLASVVENRVIGIVGNSLVMPVAPGFQLDPNYEPEVVDAKTGEVVPLLDYYRDGPADPLRISVPTKGVFAEAVMGHCNSCEKKEEDRFWRWEESPIPDQPTAIQPISTDTRRAEPGDLSPQQLPAPIINLQNAPAAPAPAGFGGLLELLGTPNLFRDITGLTENQRNALAALQASLQSAEFFGSGALQLTNTAAAMSLVSQLQEAVKAGVLSSDQAKELAAEAIRAGFGKNQTTAGAARDIREVQKLVDDKAITPRQGERAKERILEAVTSPAGNGSGQDLRQFGETLLERVPDGSGFTVTARDAEGSIEFASNPSPNGGSSGNGILDQARSFATSQLQSATQALMGALSDWRSDPDADLSAALQDAMVKYAEQEIKKQGEALVKRLPVGQALIVGAKLAVAFAEGAGNELLRVNDRLRDQYDAMVGSIQFGPNGLTEQDVETLRRLSAYQLVAVRNLQPILSKGLDKMLDRAAELAEGVGKKVFNDAFNQLLVSLAKNSELLSLLAGAVNDARSAIPEQRRAIEEKILGFTVKAFIKQLPKGRFQTALQDVIAPVRGASEAPIELLAGLARAMIALEFDELRELAGKMPGARGLFRDEAHRLKAQIDANPALQVVAGQDREIKIEGITLTLPSAILAEISGIDEIPAEVDLEMQAAAHAHLEFRRLQELRLAAVALDLQAKINRGRLDLRAGEDLYQQAECAAMTQVGEAFEKLDAVIRQIAAAASIGRLSNAAARRAHIEDQLFVTAGVGRWGLLERRSGLPDQLPLDRGSFPADRYQCTENQPGTLGA